MDLIKSGVFDWDETHILSFLFIYGFFLKGNFVETIWLILEIVVFNTVIVFLVLLIRIVENEMSLLCWAEDMKSCQECYCI